MLAGVKSVAIFDPEPVTVQDLSSQASHDDSHQRYLADRSIPSSFYALKTLGSLERLLPSLGSLN